MNELQAWLPRLGILPVVNFPLQSVNLTKQLQVPRVRILVKSIIERRIEEPTPVK